MGSEQMYLDDNDYIMPPAAGLPSFEEEDKPAITKFLKRYIDDLKAFRCPADTLEKYYETETTSYEYNAFLGGKRIDKNFLTKRLNFKERDIHVLYDYKPFHSKDRKPGGTNYLYADGHVADAEN